MNEKDVLERQYFVNRIQKLIEINGEKNLSIGINGSWGCGKSFVLHMIDDALEEKKINEKFVLPFYYDVWKYDYYEEPIVSLISFLYKKISGMKSSLFSEAEKKVMKGFSLALSGIAENLTGINPSSIVAEISKTEEETFDTYVALNSAIEEVNKSLKEFTKTFKVVLIIDELDRCLPEYSIKVLERLHHICDGTNCIQIIAYDKNQISDSIGNLYGKEFLNEEEKLIFTDSYLRKFEDLELSLDYGTMNENIFLLFSVYDDMYFDNIVTKEKVLEIFNEFISMWGMRNVKQLIQKAYFLHNIIKNNDHSFIPEQMRKGKFSYVLLIAELLECICVFELKLTHPYFDKCRDVHGNFSLSLETENSSKRIENFKSKIRSFTITSETDHHGFVTYKVIYDFNNLLTYILTSEGNSITPGVLLPQVNESQYLSEKFFFQEFVSTVNLIM